MNSGAFADQTAILFDRIVPCSCDRPDRRSIVKSMSKFLCTPFQTSIHSRCGSSWASARRATEYHMYEWFGPHLTRVTAVGVPSVSDFTSHSPIKNSYEA